MILKTHQISPGAEIEQKYGAFTCIYHFIPDLYLLVYNRKTELHMASLSPTTQICMVNTPNFPHLETHQNQVSKAIVSASLPTYG
jgi:hypothetical protein